MFNPINRLIAFGEKEGTWFNRLLKTSMAGGPKGHLATAALIAPGAMMSIGMWAGIASLLSSDDDDYNTQEGMSHKGMAGATRKYRTDFGSGSKYGLRAFKAGISFFLDLGSKKGTYMVGGKELLSTTYKSERAAIEAWGRWSKASAATSRRTRLDLLKAQQKQLNPFRIDNIGKLPSAQQRVHDRGTVSGMQDRLHWLEKRMEHQRYWDEHYKQQEALADTLSGPVIVPGRPAANRAVNPIEAMPESGIGPDMRKKLTDFGSAFRGMVASSKILQSLLSAGKDVPVDVMRREMYTYAKSLGINFQKARPYRYAALNPVMTKGPRRFWKMRKTVVVPTVGEGDSFIKGFLNATGSESAKEASKYLDTIDPNLLHLSNVFHEMSEQYHLMLRAAPEMAIENRSLAKSYADIEQTLSANPMGSKDIRDAWFRLEALKSKGNMDSLFDILSEGTSHVSRAVIADEALLSRALGKKAFKAAAHMRKAEADVYLSGLTKAVEEEVQGYTRRTANVYKSVHANWDRVRKSVVNATPIDLAGVLQRRGMRRTINVPVGQDKAINPAYLKNLPSVEKPGIQSSVNANTIEGIRHGGMAENMREGLGIAFGSGWTRDVTWTLPYLLSLSRDRVGPIYAGIAKDRALRDIKKPRRRTVGALIGGISSIETQALPSVVHSSMVDANTKVRTHSTWGNLGHHGPLEGLTHQGRAGATRHYRTGFGSGWRGTDATLQAQQDFAGFTPPKVQRSPMADPKVVNAAARRAETLGNIPEVQVKLAQLGLIRHVVDRDISRLIEDNFGRKVKDYIRKASMAQNQDQTVYSLFFNAIKGAKRHISKAV